MGNEGPTTVATIVAKIKGDLDEWEAAYKTALAQGHELDAMSPTINVDANVGEALAKLEAVEAAEKKLQATEAESSKKLAVASKQRAIYNQYLYDEAKASKLAAEAGKDQAQLQYWQKILAVVGALVPLMSPLATQAFSVGAAFGAMGAAGVLAVFGIKNAIEDGNATGRQYSAGLRVLKADFDSLSQTSAVAMLKSYNLAIGQIHQAMPALNSDVGLFSKLLGQAGNSLLASLIAGLRIAKPLLLDAGQYISQVAADLLKWTNNGGFQSFVNYAISMLPRVASALGQLATLLINVIRAAAPIGTVVLAALQGISTALNLLPLPVLTAMITAGGTFFVTFKLWSALTPILTAVAESLVAVGVAEDLALGPIGLVVAAVTALAGAAAITAVSMGTAAEAQQSYTSAIQQDNGAIGDHTKAQAASNLQASGALTIARQLGISTKTLTDATLGNSYAQAGLAGKIKALTAELTAMDQANAAAADTTAGAQTQAAAKLADQLQKLTAEYATQQKQVKDAWKAYNDLAAAQGLTTYTTTAQQAAVTDLAGKYGESVGVYLGAKAAQKQTEDQLKATTAAMVQENDASSLLTNALTLLNGGSLSVAQSQTGLAAANNSLVDSFKQNGHVVDGSTKAAVANQQAIQQQVQAAQQAAEAIGKQTGSSVAAVAAYKDSKDAIEAQLKAQGDLTPAVQAYIDKLYDVAALKVPPTKLDVDDAEALKKLQAWQDAVHALTNNISLHVSSSGQVTYSDAKGHAAGGTVGPSGTVFGPGSTTSDSILTRLSRGEEVVNASAASAPGVRPLLKSLNSDPTGTMAALGVPSTKQTVINHQWGVITQADPRAAIVDAMRQSEARAA